MFLETVGSSGARIRHVLFIADPLTPEPELWIYINIYGVNLNWPGQSWDLDLGLFDSQWSLKTQS